MKKKLFSSLKIGNFQLKNRFVFNPITLNVSKDNQVCQADIDFYKHRAHSASLFVTGGVFVDENGSLFKFGHSATENSNVFGLKKLAKAIKSKKNVAILQLIHAGSHSLAAVEKFGFSFGPSSSIRNYPWKYSVFRLNQKQIQKIIKKYAEATKRAIDAEFDGIEVSAAQKLLPQEFLSTYTNKRNDKYSAKNLTNRTRFLIQVLIEVQKTIQKSGQKNFLLGLRMTTEERRGNDFGYTIEDFFDFLTQIEKNHIKIDYLAIAGWGKDLFKDRVRSPGKYFGKLVSEVIYEKYQGKIPIMINGSINSFEKCKVAIKFADLVGLSSVFVSEPDFVDKVSKNQEINLNLAGKNFKKLKIPKNAFQEISHYFDYGQTLPNESRENISKNAKDRKKTISVR